MNKIISFLIILFFAIPMSNVFGAEGGIFHGIPINSNTGVSISWPTDGDSTTGSNVRNSPVPVYDFDEPVHILEYYIEGSATINFYSDKERTKLIKTISSPIGNSGKWNEIDVEGVMSIMATNGGGSSNVWLYELDFKTLEPINYEPVKFLKETHGFNHVNLSWENPVGSEFTGITIQQNGIDVVSLLNDVETYTITGLNPETEYTFEVMAKYSDGTLSESQRIVVTTSAIPDDINPPGEISNLAFGVSSTGVMFTWINPVDSDFSHVRIYRDNKLIEASHTQDSYDVNGLIPNTTYLFKFVTVDENGNNSLGYVQTVKTDSEVDNQAPSTPTGLNVTNGNGSGFVRWNRNTELDMLGYNVYIDGIKHNTSVVMSNSYVISNLSNDQSYTITITAVDTSYNESEHSSSVLLVPFAGGMPVFETNYDLKLVADGTSSWFSALWPLLAFAVGIPLAFYVSNRVKTLFFA